MSVSSFPKEYYHSHLNNMVVSVKDSLATLKTKESAPIYHALDELSQFWSQEISHPSLNIDQLNAKESDTLSKVDQLVSTFFTKNEGDDLSSKLSSRALEEIHYLKLVLQMNYLLDQKDQSLELFFQHPLGKELFFDLAKMNDPRVIATLHKIVSEGKKEFTPIIEELVLVLAKDHHPNFICLIFDLIMRDNSGWIGEMVTRFIIEKSSAAPLLFENLLKQASDNLEPNSICALFNTLVQIDPAQKEHCVFIEKILQMTADKINPNESLQNLLMVFITEMPHTTPILEPLFSGIEKFHSVKPSFPINKMTLLQRLATFSETASLKLAPVPSKEHLKRKTKWGEYDLKFRLSLKILHIQRDRKLIEFTLSNKGESLKKNSTNSISSNLFPDSSAIIVGHNIETKGSEYYIGKIAGSIKPNSSFTTYAPDSQEKPLKHLEGKIKRIQGQQSSYRWLQDVCMITKNTEKKSSSFLFPRFTPLLEIDHHIFIGMRSDRANALASALNPKLKLDKTTFPIQGQICYYGNQFSFFENLLQNCRTLKDFSQAFCFFEGGNILIGEDPHPYAVVGEDVFTMNQLLLGYDLKDLGLMREGEFWTLQPVKESERNLLLTPEEVQYYLASDLGLASLEQVCHMVQLDYHIDMSATILGPKVIAIEDSMASYHLQHQEVSASRERYTEQNLKELEVVLSEAKVLTPYEDLAVSQLREQGFKVVKVPGRIKVLEPKAPVRLDQVNFFNFVTLKMHDSGGELNKFVVIALDTPQEDFARFKEMFEHSSVPFDQIEFLFIDPEQSKMLLKDGGGIRCLTKVIEYPLPFKEI